MKMIRSAVFLVVCLGLVTGAGAAETGFYVGAELAVVEAGVGKSDGIFIATPDFVVRVFPDSLHFDGSTTGWGAVLGYRINRYLAGELAYVDFGSVAIQEKYDVTDLFPFPIDPPIIFTNDVASRVYGPAVSLLGILPVADGFEAFARAGLLFSDQELRLIPGDFVRTFGDELWIIGAGIDVAMTPRWSARFEYQSLDRLEGTDFTGPIRLERFVFGISYDF
jgi:hypothetical protein